MKCFETPVEFELNDPHIDPASPEFDPLCFELSLPPERRRELHERFRSLMAAVRRYNEAMGISPRWTKATPGEQDKSEFESLSDEEIGRLIEM